MMILAINGSHKKEDGINQLLIDTLFEGAKKSGAECETIRLSRKNINPCIACNFCQNQSEYKCIYDDKDDFVGIVAKIKSADIVIYSTPVYVFQMSGKMKSFLDRFYGRGKSNIKSITKSGLFFHDVENELCGKPFVSIIVSDNIESKTTRNVEQYFKTFSQFLDAPHVGSIVRNGSFIFKRDTNLKNQQGKVNNILQSVRKAGQLLAVNGHIPRKIQANIRQNILPIPAFMFNLFKRTKFTRAKLLKKAEM